MARSPAAACWRMRSGRIARTSGRDGGPGRRRMPERTAPAGRAPGPPGLGPRGRDRPAAAPIRMAAHARRARPPRGHEAACHRGPWAVGAIVVEPAREAAIRGAPRWVLVGVGRPLSGSGGSDGFATGSSDGFCGRSSDGLSSAAGGAARRRSRSIAGASIAEARRSGRGRARPRHVASAGGVRRLGRGRQHAVASRTRPYRHDAAQARTAFGHLHSLGKSLPPLRFHALFEHRGEAPCPPESRASAQAVAARRCASLEALDVARQHLDLRPAHSEPHVHDGATVRLAQCRDLVGAPLHLLGVARRTPRGSSRRCRRRPRRRRSRSAPSGSRRRSRRRWA